MKITPQEQSVKISLPGAVLEGNLFIPANAKGIVLFAHGSGSSRFSPRNQFVAKMLQEGDLATLLIDLLTAEEEAIDEVTRALRFDIDLLAERLIEITDWLEQEESTKSLFLGYFGSSTGAAAALVAAAKKKKRVNAVVSRGGRPDLAMEKLIQVTAPTLLIVGGRDVGVIELNLAAHDLLRCEKKIEIVPEATHLFEEPGALESVGRLARQWFIRHF